MEEQYLRDIRTLLILERARALSTEPSNARNPEELEKLFRDGKEVVRVKLGACLEMALHELQQAAAFLDKKLGTD